jgi:exonuclease SbcC
VWRDLNDALGSADGKKLRVHAQRLTLALLVREASRHLADLAPRYAIELAPSELSLHVIDRSMGGEVRTTTALSGGETFVVSLALALGLAGLASRRMRLGTLFVDEGFGSLDAASLEVVLGALDALEATGRQIGIVSHVPELEERFAARVEVRPEGHGKSRVVVVG